jgi:hypothetical protein
VQFADNACVAVIYRRGDAGVVGKSCLGPAIRTREPDREERTVLLHD